MPNDSNICLGCPAAFALGIYAEEAAVQNSETAKEMRQNEARQAKHVLEVAAGQTACSIIEKEMPELPETVPSTGSSELIEFVSQCPSFGSYLALRAAQTNQ